MKTMSSIKIAKAAAVLLLAAGASGAAAQTAPPAVLTRIDLRADGRPTTMACTFRLTARNFTGIAVMSGQGIVSAVGLDVAGMTVTVNGVGQGVRVTGASGPVEFIRGGDLDGLLLKANGVFFDYYESGPGAAAWIHRRLRRLHRPGPDPTGLTVGLDYWHDVRQGVGRLAKIGDIAFTYYPYEGLDRGGYDAGRISWIAGSPVRYHTDALTYMAGTVSSIGMPPPIRPPEVRFGYFSDAGPRSGRIGWIEDVRFEYEQNLNPDRNVNLLGVPANGPVSQALPNRIVRMTGSSPGGVQIVVQGLGAAPPPPTPPRRTPPPPRPGRGPPGGATGAGQASPPAASTPNQPAGQPSPQTGGASAVQTPHLGGRWIYGDRGQADVAQRGSAITIELHWADPSSPGHYMVTGDVAGSRVSGHWSGGSPRLGQARGVFHATVGPDGKSIRIHDTEDPGGQYHWNELILRRP